MDVSCNEEGGAIRWRELEIAPDGTKQRVLRYENLGDVTRRDAVTALSKKLALAGTGPVRSRVTFETIAHQWIATVVPMYKPSTQKNHRHILGKHLMPRFGDKAIADVTRQEIQAYVAHLQAKGYAPKSIDHMHDVLSAILRTAVKWGHLPENPARGVDLPALRNVKPKWAPTFDQSQTGSRSQNAVSRTPDPNRTSDTSRTVVPRLLMRTPRPRAATMGDRSW